MADDDEGQEAPADEPKPKPLFGGKQAPLFKKKGKAAKLLDDHKLLAISTIVAIIGLVYLVLHNRASSTAGSTSSNVSGQSTAADNVPDAATTSSSPSDFQPWWQGDAGGGGGGGLENPAPPTSSGTPKPKTASTPAAKGAAPAQPSSHPKSTAAKAGPASAAAPRSTNRAATLAGLYAPLEPSSSPVHSVAATAHPASHVAVGTSRNGSNVLVPFTVRAGQVPPTGSSPSTHLAAAAKRPAGARATGRR